MRASKRKYKAMRQRKRKIVSPQSTRHPPQICRPRKQLESNNLASTQHARNMCNVKYSASGPSSVPLRERSDFDDSNQKVAPGASAAACGACAVQLAPIAAAVSTHAWPRRRHNSCTPSLSSCSCRCLSALPRSPRPQEGGVGGEEQRTRQQQQLVSAREGGRWLCRGHGRTFAMAARE